MVIIGFDKVCVTIRQVEIRPTTAATVKTAKLTAFSNYKDSKKNSFRIWMDRKLTETEIPLSSVCYSCN